MREMVLNHASLPGYSKRQASDQLMDLVRGMARLVSSSVAMSSLRTTRPIHEIACDEQNSFFDIWILLRANGAVEEFRFLMGLTTKTPMLTELGEDVRGRFLACEEQTLRQEDGKPLLLCALTNWIAVGFPKEPWDNDSIVVRFEELLPNDAVRIEEEMVDYLGRRDHADAIVRRHAENTRAGFDVQLLWEQREVAFPYLQFGPDVREHLEDVNPGHIHTVLRRLAELHASAERWRDSGEAAPLWSCKVTGESQSVRNNPSLREARRFRSNSGEGELFLYHARYGNSGRIHLRWDRSGYLVEIGYIGRHLPL